MARDYYGDGPEAQISISNLKVISFVKGVFSDRNK